MTNLSDLNVYTIKTGQKWVAATNRSPYFCFEADTRDEALAKAKRALAFYETALRMQDGVNGGRERRAAGWQKMTAEELVAA
ncbi:hypothetical protein [Salinarimonas sp.]|uniref:hypothetical protein n=1 Tax=Salinarimonas sp. TaxID=2766526 RepID=UPI0032D91D34